MKRALTICLIVLAMIATTRAQVTNSYHFSRTFVPVTNAPGTPTLYKVIIGAKELTGLVGPTNLYIWSNQTYATEYEGYSWGYESANTAWTSAFTIYQNYSSNYPGMTYDNAGWIKGTRQAYGDWGAFIWLLQNTIAFTSSASSVYVSSGGATSPIASVLVGTLGDYCPQTAVTETATPQFDTNYPGSNMGTDQVFKADTMAYYKLVPFTYLGVNNDDSDGDGIPDFADGYDFSATNSADDISTNDFFMPWKVQLSSNVSPTQALISITYSASDPANVTVTTNGYTPATNGYFRIWTKKGSTNRNKSAVTNGGDYIPSGTYAATNLGFNATNRIVDIFIEPINPTTNREIVIQVDPDGANTAKEFVCMDKFSITAFKAEILRRVDKKGAYLPLTADTRFVSIGQFMDFTSRISPSSINLPKPKWTVPGQLFSDYKMGDDQADLVHFNSNSLQNADGVQFYWCRAPTSASVRFSVAVPGGLIEAEEVMNVCTPTSSLTISMVQPDVATFSSGALIRWGNIEIGQHGFITQFGVFVDDKFKNGSCGLNQLIQMGRTRSSQTHSYHLRKNGLWAADQAIFSFGEKKLNVLTNTMDAPRMPLPSPFHSEDESGAVIQEAFKLALMFEASRRKRSLCSAAEN